jgi:quinoprotein glucose dehydrogenase
MHGLTIAALLVLAAGECLTAADSGDWPFYGQDAGGQRFSSLTQINAGNVDRLKVAWTFRTGDAYQPEHDKATAFEATPLYIDGTLYLSTPLGRAMALDPLKGTQIWAYDPHIDKDAGYGDYANRGVSAWRTSAGKLRILVATIDARLVELDAATGKPIEAFGDNGVIDLRQGLRIAAGKNHYADYEETSPPAVIGDTIVVGSAVADNYSAAQPSGEVRAYEAPTGKLKWTWDPIPQDATDPAASTWKNGSAAKTGAGNAWSRIAVDEERGLVFVPTGSPSPDYYGGERLGDNRYADSMVALRAATGKVVWQFQTVHHDLWDYDVATPPLLFEMQRGGKAIPAIAIGSKTGNVFILNRETGAPIFGVEERAASKSDTPGEETAATQPFPILPKPVTPQGSSPESAWGMDEADKKWCQDEISKLRTGPIFTPPSVQGILQVPGNVGGMNWGGFAYDPTRELLVLPENHLAAEVKLIPRSEFADLRASRDRKLDGDWELAPQHGTGFGMMRRILLSANHHLPCVAPPWSTLVAIDVKTGATKWDVPLGRFSPKVPAAWGAVSLGGPMMTASGLTFVAGTVDPAIRAFNSETGKELWIGELPTSARSTPMTYRGTDRKQYLVVCAGGHGIKGMAPLGDYVVAFALDAK